LALPSDIEKELQFGVDELLRSGSLKGILFFFSNYTQGTPNTRLFLHIVLIRQDKIHIEYFVLAIGNFYEPRNFMQAMKEILASETIDKLKLSMVESRFSFSFSFFVGLTYF
jgi:hypothetical protein